MTPPGPVRGTYPAMLRGQSPSGAIGAPRGCGVCWPQSLQVVPLAVLATFPWDQTACSGGSGGDRGQILASSSHSFYLLSLGYSTLDSFPECPLGVEASKAESPQLHRPPCPPRPPRGAASARPGPHVHIRDLPSELGEEAATSACWRPVVGSGGVGALLPECGGGFEGPAHPPGALGS